MSRGREDDVVNADESVPSFASPERTSSANNDQEKPP
jgi:hypothetical protein